MNSKNILKGELRKYGITIEQLAEHLGVSPGTISMKLNGKHDFSLSQARQITDYINSFGEEHTVESLFVVSRNFFTPVSTLVDKQ